MPGTLTSAVPPAPADLPGYSSRRIAHPCEKETLSLDRRHLSRAGYRRLPLSPCHSPCMMTAHWQAPPLCHGELHPVGDSGSERSEPKISWPTSNASTKESTTPWGWPLACRHAWRCSWMQKKLMFGQRDWATGQQSSSDSGNHTTISEG